MTTTYEERPFQTEAKDAIQKEWRNGNRNTLLVLPTGTGKTIVFCRLIEDLVRDGKRVLILAHRGELLDQAADKLSRATGLKCAVEKAESTCLGEWFRVVVGSVQTLMQEKRLAKFPTDYFDAIIVDEADLALADSYRRVLNHFSSACLLGVTATPDRGDMRNLGELFQSLAYEYSLPQAIKDGYLSPIKALTIPLEINLTGVKQQSGDFQAAALGSALDPYLEQIAEHMIEHCTGRKTLVFLPLIATSQKFCALLNAKGLRTIEVNGKSEYRDTVQTDFEAGKYDVICNAMLYNRGWDCPCVDTVVPLRATKIRSLFAQMVGRGTRLFPGKDHLLLLDFLWNTAKMDLCRPACLIAPNEEVAAKMTKNINEDGGAVDLEEAEKKAETDCVAEREDALAATLAGLRHKKRKLVDPLQFEMSIMAEDLADYVPSFGHEMEPPSIKQVASLEKAGIFPDDIECSGKASLILDKLAKRRSESLTTPRQIRVLERMGFVNKESRVGQWEFDDARRLIDRIAGNGWRVPRDISPKKHKPKQKEPSDDLFGLPSVGNGDEQ